MKTYDFAYKHTRTIAVTRKNTVLSAIDAFIAGFVMMAFVLLVLIVGFIIFG